MDQLFGYNPSPDFIYGLLTGIGTTLLAQWLYHVLAKRRALEDWKMRARGGDPVAQKSLKVRRSQRTEQLKRVCFLLLALLIVLSCGLFSYDHFRLREYPPMFDIDTTGDLTQPITVSDGCVFARFLYWSDAEADAAGALYPTDVASEPLFLDLIRPRFPYVYDIYRTRHVLPGQYALIVEGPEEPWRIRAECLDEAIRARGQSDPNYLRARDLATYTASTPTPSPTTQ